MSFQASAKTSSDGYVSRARSIVTFWTSQEPSRQFGADPKFDSLIREQYRDAVEEALAGKLRHWDADPMGSLALVILLDQFCLSIFRGHARRYEGKAPARKVSLAAMDAHHLDSHP